jgi:hypothetical protein
MLPVEISSLTDQMTTSGQACASPPAASRCPSISSTSWSSRASGFDGKGYRIGRGMGFYDRFLAQAEFIGTACGLAFDEQIVSGELPVLDHDIPLSMLVTDRGIRRFASNCIEK